MATVTSYRQENNGFSRTSPDLAPFQLREDHMKKKCEWWFQPPTCAHSWHCLLTLPTPQCADRFQITTSERKHQVESSPTVPEQCGLTSKYLHIQQYLPHCWPHLFPIQLQTITFYTSVFHNSSWYHPFSRIFSGTQHLTWGSQRSVVLWSNLALWSYRHWAEMAKAKSGFHLVEMHQNLLFRYSTL